jgi:hypothetical protein
MELAVHEKGAQELENPKLPDSLVRVQVTFASIRRGRSTLNTTPLTAQHYTVYI